MMTFNEFVATRQDMTVDGYVKNYGDQILQEDDGNVQRVLVYEGFYILDIVDYGYVLNIYNESYSGTLPEMEKKLWEYAKFELGSVEYKRYPEYDRWVAVFIDPKNAEIGLAFHQGASQLLKDYVEKPCPHVSEIFDRLAISRDEVGIEVKDQTVNDAIELYCAAFILQEEALDKLFNK